jgi:hypothetical protein
MHRAQCWSPELNHRRDVTDVLGHRLQGIPLEGYRFRVGSDDPRCSAITKTGDVALLLYGDCHEHNTAINT